MSDLEAVGLFAALLAVSVAIGEGLRALGWAAESTRRLVHVGVGLATAAAPMWFSGPVGMYALAILFMVGNAVLMSRGWGASMHAIKRRSWGTVVFPFALIVALGLTWSLDPSRVFVLQIAFVVLALADPAASFVGTRVSSSRPYLVAGATKSLAGSTAFALVTLVSTAILLLWIGPEWSALEVAVAAITVSALATVAEALGRGGWDNLWIVLAVVVPLSHLDGSPPALVVEGLALVLAALFGVLTFRVRALDVSGALVGSLLAWMLVALGGLVWAAPALAFFVLSSAVSRVGEQRKATSRTLEAKGSRRDAGQVLANGGVGMLLLGASVFGESPMLYPGFVGAFAAAAADTWATEIGTAFKGPTRRLGVGRRVQPGESGGMSVAGTTASIVGSATVVGAAWAVGGLEAGPVALVLVVAGVVGSVLDTALGATVQARYRRLDGTLSEVALEGADRVGWGWVDNDAVNWAGTVAGADGGALVGLAAW